MNNPFVKAKLYQTHGIARLCKEKEDFKTQVIVSLGRFYAKDWGECDEADMESNDCALQYTEMVVGVYETTCGTIWLIAESSDKAAYDTIVITLPEEY